MRFRERKTFERELRQQPQYKAAMAERAEVLGHVIEAAAPYKTGYFVRRVRPRGNRVFLRDFAWHWVEFGSIHNPPYAPVRRSVRALGLRYEDAHSDVTGEVQHMPGIS